MGSTRAFWLLVIVTVTALTVPVAVWPHWVSFVVPPLLILILCELILRGLSTCSSSQALLADSNVLSPAACEEHTSSSPHGITSAAQKVDRLLVVRVERLVEALELLPAELVMTKLWNTDELLDSVPADSGFALVSYRQEGPPPPHAAHDRKKASAPKEKHADSSCFTMDEHALRCVVTAAVEAGVEALWLDAWSFRSKGEYNHATFCTLLSTVAMRARAVIWLPVSKVGAAPSYQFRLWCTFEASVVAARELPVYIACEGGKLPRSQRALHFWGAKLPAVPFLAPPPDEIRHLAYMNLAWFIMCSCCPVLLILWNNIFRDPLAVGDQLPVIGRQVALARNGQKVLQVMLAASTRGNRSNAVKKALACDRKRRVERLAAPARASQGMPISDSVLLSSSLRAQLPWLPAYDRRDALIIDAVLRQLETAGVLDLAVDTPSCRPRVRTRLDSSAIAMSYLGRCSAVSGAQPPPQLARASGAARASQSSPGAKAALTAVANQRALALSIFAATLQQPSGGRRPIAQVAGHWDIYAWLEEYQMEGALATHDEALCTVSLRSLDAFGWSVQRGASCFMQNPMGKLRMNAPEGHEWCATSMQPLRESPEWLQVAVLPVALFVAALSMVALCSAVINGLVTGHWFVLREYVFPISCALNAGMQLALVVTNFLIPAALNSDLADEAPHLVDPMRGVQPEGYRQAQSSTQP